MRYVVESPVANCWCAILFILQLFPVLMPTRGLNIHFAVSIFMICNMVKFRHQLKMNLELSELIYRLVSFPSLQLYDQLRRKESAISLRFY